jgi:aminocarboxymuconate-semialdehyde decarboxylase
MNTRVGSPTVDVHAHVIPPQLIEAVRVGEGPDGIRLESRRGRSWLVHRQGYAYPLLPAFHDVQARIAAMDEIGAARALISAPPTFFFYWVKPRIGVQIARVVNDGVAALVADAPRHFDGLATLPLADPVAAVAELERVVGTLGMRGAQTGPHCEGIPLDHPSLGPVLEAAARLGVPMVVHPYYVESSAGLDDFYLTNLQGNPWQTAICASRLILGGVLDELPELNVLLVHGGGHLPYQIGRLDHGYRVRQEAARPIHLPSLYLRHFHSPRSHFPTKNGGSSGTERPRHCLASVRVMTAGSLLQCPTPQGGCDDSSQLSAPCRRRRPAG